MKAVIYARVSTAEQTIESQLVGLTNFAGRNGIEIVGLYIDEESAYHVAPWERESWVKAVEAALRSRAAILVFSLDRIARRYDHLIKTLAELNEKGVQVISVQESWLQSLATIPDETLRKMMFDIIVRALAYSYEMYVKSIIEKTKAGLERARKEGKRIGRPPAIPEEYYLKLIRKYPGSPIRQLWRIALGDGYKISYSRFNRNIRRIAQKYNIPLKRGEWILDTKKTS